MVEELDAEQIGGGLQGGGELQIGLAGRGIAGGMVVGDDDCIRIDLERLAKHLSELYRSCSANVSERDKNWLADQAAFLVDR